MVPEFGTPVRGKWWKRLLNIRATVLSDNTMITVYPFNGSDSSSIVRLLLFNLEVAAFMPPHPSIS